MATHKENIPTKVLPLKNIFSGNQWAWRFCLPYGYGPVVCSKHNHRTDVMGRDSLRGISQENVWVIRLNVLLSIEDRDHVLVRTVTSTVFLCPTKLISDVHEFREMTAAMKT